MNDTSENQSTGAAANHPAFVMDGDGMIVEWSDEAQRVFGYSAAEAVGHRLSELIIPDRHRIAHEAGLKRFMSAGSAGALLNRKLDLTMLHRDGREFPLAIRIETRKVPQGAMFPTFIERD